MSIGGFILSLGKRVMVSCSIVCSLVSDKNCLGNAARDFGHKRLPVPPARITGVIIKCSLQSSTFKPTNASINVAVVAIVLCIKC